MPLIIIINIIIQRNQQKNSNYRVLLKINDIKRMRIEKYLYSLNALDQRWPTRGTRATICPR
jgi:hypothetical protein